MRKKKIGIVTFHNAHNYGAMLQAFALLNILKKYDQYESEIIDYYDKKLYGDYKIIRPVTNDLGLSIKRFLIDVAKFDKKVMRYKRFNKFINSKCNLSKRYNSEEALKNENLDYDILITGSDQVWNTSIVGNLSDIFTLNFGKDNINRISYAASVGNIKFIDNEINIFKEKLNIIDSISVREAEMKDKIENLLDKEVEVVLDPTLLLTKEEWEAEIKVECDIKEDYILAYDVAPDDEYRNIVNDLSKRTGLKVIYFNIRNHGYINGLKSAYITDPLDFVRYIKNAKYVVTTSFHATVFSIIFHKKFFVIPHKNTSSRVTNLIDKLEIKNRIFYKVDDFRKIDFNFMTEWELVDKKLNLERNKSIEWLENALLLERKLECRK